MRADLDTLVLAAAQGDTEAYGRLVDETSPLVSSIALAILRDVEISRDVAQDVFLSVWRDLKKLRNPASFLPWLRQVARNRARIALRTNWRKRKLGETGLDDLLPLVTDPRPNAAEQMLATEQARALSEALSNLPEDTREVLTLFYREEQSIAQVASLLELSETAVKKRLSRAREALRAGILDQAGETLRRTKPGSEFTAMVVGALPMSAPPGAAVATLLAKLHVPAAWAAAAKILLPFSGALLGAAGGSAGVLIGARKLHKAAMDERERREIRVHALVSVGVVVLFSIAFPLVWLATHSRTWAIAWFLAFLAALALLLHAWLPRIIRRRMQFEMRENPQAALDRRRRERRQAIIGWTLGILSGSIGLAVGLWFTRH
jgi:RNA polymerase sigma factor (sigma-70 family)